jgi:hypothetical protein
LCHHFATERGLVDVVDERAPSLDLDHGQPFAVTGLELGITADVDLLEPKSELLLEGAELRPRPLAEVAALGPVEDDGRYG